MTTRTPALSERRKADRARMATLLAEAVTAAGATVTTIDYETHVYPDGSRPSRTRCIAVDIAAPGGATIGVRFSGDSPQPDVFVATWNTPRGVFLNPDVFWNCNQHHYGKSTVVCSGLDHLVATLERDVERFADGSGYLPHDDARIVAMRARYEAQGWPWHDGEA